MPTHCCASSVPAKSQENSGERFDQAFVIASKQFGIAHRSLPLVIRRQVRNIDPVTFRQSLAWISAGAGSRLLAMLRRMATLAVVLLSLLGAVPAVLACAFVAEEMDCCPAHQPCATQYTCSVAAPPEASCCTLQPAVQPAVMLASPKSDRSFAAPPFPDHWVISSAEIPGVRAPPFPSSLPPSARGNPADQRRTYLLTGRLRL